MDRCINILLKARRYDWADSLSKLLLKNKKKLVLQRSKDVTEFTVIEPER